MSDEKLKQYLHGTGMACFVKYFRKFANDTLSNAEIIEQIRKNEGYTKQACQTRTSKARSIIKAGRSRDALKKVSESQKVCSWAREKAQHLLSEGS